MVYSYVAPSSLSAPVIIHSKLVRCCTWLISVWICTSWFGTQAKWVSVEVLPLIESSWSEAALSFACVRLHMVCRSVHPWNTYMGRELVSFSCFWIKCDSTILDPIFVCSNPPWYTFRTHPLALVVYCLWDCLSSSIKGLSTLFSLNTLLSLAKNRSQYFPRTYLWLWRPPSG